MPAAGKPRRLPSPPPMDAAARIAARDEILQVMFWLRGESLAQEVSSAELAKWIGLRAEEIEPLLVEMLGSRLVDRVVVDSGVGEGTLRFRLTASGVQEGQRRFAEEFSGLTQPHHFEHSDPACDCEDVSRFSVSLKKGLSRQFDEMMEAKGYSNRSLAIGNMIRQKLAAHRQEAGEFEAVGTIMVAYDSHDRRIRAAFDDLQEEYMATIVSTVRVQSAPRRGTEVWVVRGKASAIRVLADRLIGAKGVRDGKLSLTAASVSVAD